MRYFLDVGLNTNVQPLKFVMTHVKKTKSMNAGDQPMEDAVQKPAGAGLSDVQAAGSASEACINPPLRLRILVVEDDGLIGTLLGDMLELLGHKVCAIEVTEDGAIAAAAKFSPNFMIVDAQLRSGSGISAVDAILKNGLVPHVFVTGDVFEIRKLRPNAVVIEKPFSEATLTAAINRAYRAV